MPGCLVFLSIWWSCRGSAPLLLGAAFQDGGIYAFAGSVQHLNLVSISARRRPSVVESF